MMTFRPLLSMVVLLTVAMSPLVNSQAEFRLPTLTRNEPPKPTISPELAHYFQLPDAGARRFVGSYFPGLVPPPNFEVADPQLLNGALPTGLNGQPFGVLTGGGADQLPPGLLAGGGGGAGVGGAGPQSGLGFPQASLASLQAFLGGGGGGAGANPALSPGFSLKPASGAVLAAFGNETVGVDADNETSQIAGIPRIFPTLPKAPVPQTPVQVAPALPTRPEVPQGGLGPLAGLSGQSFGGNSGASFLPGTGLQSGTAAGGNNPLSAAAAAALQQQQQQQQQQQVPQSAAGNENLLAQLLRTFGLNTLAPNLDLATLNQALQSGSLLNGNGPALGGQQQQQQQQQQAGLLSNVVYSALTDANSQTAKPGGVNATELVSNKANAALIQNLITQPGSPLCNPKPKPVEDFDLDAFMGKWYQVLYSPPLSAGPCSMVTYQKLADVGQGGPGTVFDTFEYTTEGTPYGKPRISSGYSIVRGPGQLIYRTTNSASDVNVYVLETGPLDESGQYEYAVLAVNCNYPLHVFARDPVQYKQKYETEVNALLEQRGIVTSWSRLLNLVAPVDYNLCTFPPTLFNVRG